MPSFSSKSVAGGGGGGGGGGTKRDRGRNPFLCARKKQKRLDAIRDNPLLLPHPRLDYDEESARLRRISRLRRVPQVLDSSPMPFFRWENPNPPDSRKGKRKRIGKGKEKARFPLWIQEKPPRDFRSRLRPTAEK